MTSVSTIYYSLFWHVFIQTGFVKAFSESPLSFTAGYCHVERVMKSLFVRKLFLWPRFQVDIQSYLKKHQVWYDTILYDMVLYVSCAMVHDVCVVGVE